MKRFDHPMSPAVWELAEKYGVVLANRLATMKHVFDGKTLATWWVKTRWEYTPTGQYVRKVDRVLPLSDHDLLHEIAHYVAADPCQRDLPEYGCGSTDTFDEAYAPLVLDLPEAEVQEFLSQMLSVHWGKKFKLPTAILSSEPDWITDWDEYLSYKTQNHLSPRNWQEAEARFKRLVNEGVVDTL